MEQLPDGPSLDALVDAVMLRLLQRGPTGDPVPQLPPSQRWPQMPQLPPNLEDFPGIKLYSRLAIDGLEFTQSIQHYGTGYGVDNSVPLVALKPMVVRVYPVVERGLLGGDALTGERVTGELVLSQWGREVYRTGPTRTDGARVGARRDLRRERWDSEDEGFFFGSVTGPGGVSMPAGPLARFTRNAPLNFRVPAWYLRKGPATVTVRLHSASGTAATRSEDITLLDVPAPKVAVVRVDWEDAMGTTSSPTDADMLGTMRLAERMLPFPYFESTILGSAEQRSGDFSVLGKDGDCNESWNKLLASLAVTRIFTALFGVGDIVFAFVPTNAILSVGKINAGCGGAEKGTGACFVGREGTFAHEIGHIYGREHVAVADDPDSDPDYPNYGGDPRSIGEVGVDLGTSPPTVHEPGDTDDIMSYGTQRWISPYTYRALLDVRYMRQSAPADPRRVRPLLILSFRVNRLVAGGRELDVKSAYRVDAAGTVGGFGARRRTAGVTIDFVDANDRIVAVHHAYASRNQAGCTCCSGGRGERDWRREPWLDYEEVLEWPTAVEIARLVIHDGGERPIGEIPVGRAPSVRIEGPRAVEAGLEVRVHVTSERDEAMSAVLLFSRDDGDTWVPVRVDVPLGEPFVVDARRLDGGERCRFRAVVTAGLQGSQADTEPFALAAASRALHLRLDADACNRNAVRLSAFVDARGLGGVQPQDVTWASDRDGELGRGFDLDVRLSDGRHAITARIPDGRGGTLAERGIIVVGGRPAELPEG
jgi:hypothetical protein